MNWREVNSFTADQSAMTSARERIASLAIPTGSLGRLHEIAIKLAGIVGHAKPKVEFCRTLVFSGDHGVARNDVSAFPAVVTHVNSTLMAEGRATISILANVLGSRLHVVDLGIDSDPYLPEQTSQFAHRLSDRKVRRGTGDITVAPAMTREEMHRAIAIGYDLIVSDEEAEIIVIGEMGIGNTTASSALVSVLLDLPASEVTGAGSGLDEEGVRRKTGIVERAVRRCLTSFPAPSPEDALMNLGGLEMAGIVGALLGAASRRIPVILDGFIVCSSYLVAGRMVAGLDDLCFAGTRSAEQGFRHLEQRLGLRPILDLGMRLGEGSGALLAYPVIRAAAAHLSAGATLDELSA